MKPCARPIELETLAAYWLGELKQTAEAPLEEHFLGCAYCAGRLEWLAACAEGVRAQVQANAVTLAITPKFLDAMKRAGLRIREHPARPGETIHCSIHADDDAVVSRLKAPLAGTKRVDVVRTTTVDGKVERWRVEDVPFDAQAGEVLLTPSTPALRRMPSHTWHVQLLAVEAGAEKSLGEYTFEHTA